MNKRLLFTALALLFISSVIAVTIRHNKVLISKNKVCYFDSCSVVLPKPVGYVNDFETIFTAEQIEALSAIIREHEKSTTNQIAIVTIRNTQLGKCNIEDYSLALGRKWGVGTKEKNNGVVIVICTGIRKIRIQNGYGIENRITDNETKTIIDSVMIPFFKVQNYYEGTLKGLLAIIEKIK